MLSLRNGTIHLKDFQEHVHTTILCHLIFKLEMRRVSGDKYWMTVDLVTDTASTSFNKHNCHPGMYLACVYDNEWYIGIVREISEDSDDVFIKFLKKDGVNFMWPRKEDECWVPFVNVLAQFISSARSWSKNIQNFRE